MTHEQHVNLVQKGITPGGVWADLGSGDGAFTLALRDLAGDSVEIYSIDKDSHRLDTQRRAFDRQFPHTNIHFIPQDFTKSLDLPPLDGVVMANSLHYVPDHVGYLKRVNDVLKPGGRLVLVEYMTDTGNPWVPYPLSFATFQGEAAKAGFSEIHILERIPSTYWNEMYAAIAMK